MSSSTQTDHAITQKPEGIFNVELFIDYIYTIRGGSRNSLKGGFRVQVRGNFHILTSKKNPTSEGGVKPPNPPPPLYPLLTIEVYVA